MFFPILFVLVFGTIGVHHFIKARRGLWSGVVEGLLFGYGGKQYTREHDRVAFSVNVWAGFLAAVVGAIVVLWGLLIAWMLILAYLGQPTL